MVIKQISRILVSCLLFVGLAHAWNVNLPVDAVDPVDLPYLKTHAVSPTLKEQLDALFTKPMMDELVVLYNVNNPDYAVTPKDIAVAQQRMRNAGFSFLGDKLNVMTHTQFPHLVFKMALPWFEDRAEDLNYSRVRMAEYLRAFASDYGLALRVPVKKFYFVPYVHAQLPLPKIMVVTEKINMAQSYPLFERVAVDTGAHYTGPLPLHVDQSMVRYLDGWVVIPTMQTITSGAWHALTMLEQKTHFTDFHEDNIHLIDGQLVVLDTEERVDKKPSGVMNKTERFLWSLFYGLFGRKQEIVAVL